MEETKFEVYTSLLDSTTLLNQLRLIEEEAILVNQYINSMSSSQIAMKTSNLTSQLEDFLKIVEIDLMKAHYPQPTSTLQLMWLVFEDITDFLLYAYSHFSYVATKKISPVGSYSDSELDDDDYNLFHTFQTFVKFFPKIHEKIKKSLDQPKDEILWTYFIILKQYLKDLLDPEYPKFQTQAALSQLCDQSSLEIVEMGKGEQGRILQRAYDMLLQFLKSGTDHSQRCLSVLDYFCSDENQLNEIHGPFKLRKSEELKDYVEYKKKKKIKTQENDSSPNKSLKMKLKEILELSKSSKKDITSIIQEIFPKKILLVPNNPLFGGYCSMLTGTIAINEVYLKNVRLANEVLWLILLRECSHFCKWYFLRQDDVRTPLCLRNLNYEDYETGDLVEYAIFEKELPPLEQLRDIIRPFTPITKFSADMLEEINKKIDGKSIIENQQIQEGSTSFAKMKKRILSASSKITIKRCLGTKF